MAAPKRPKDLLITQNHISFDPEFLKAMYPQMSPYTAPESGRRLPRERKNQCSRSTEDLELSPESALDLVVATSGLFRDYIYQND